MKKVIKWIKKMIIEETSVQMFYIIWSAIGISGIASLWSYVMEYHRIIIATPLLLSFLFFVTGMMRHGAMLHKQLNKNSDEKTNNKEKEAPPKDQKLISELKEDVSQVNNLKEKIEKLEEHLWVLRFITKYRKKYISSKKALEMEKTNFENEIKKKWGDDKTSKQIENFVKEYYG